MSEPKWTPGPWEQVTPADNLWPPRVFSGSTIVCMVDNSDAQQAERIANANLIAAAPDMAEALKAVADHFGPFAGITINGEHDPEDVRVIAMVQAALGKARGEA